MPLWKKTSNSFVIDTIAIVTVVALGVAMLSQKKKNMSKEKPPPLTEAPSGSKFVTLPESGLVIRYRDTLDDHENKTNDCDCNETFLMIHGFAGTLETWEIVTPYLLKANARVVAIDQVGLGFSDKPAVSEFDYSFRSQGKIVSELISVLGLSKVVLVGHSSGTIVSVAAAVEEQKKENSRGIVGIALLASALLRPKSELFYKSWLKPFFSWMVSNLIANRRKGLARYHLQENIERILTDDFIEKFVAPSRLPGYKHAMVETIVAKEDPYEELLDQLLLSSPTAANDTISIPLLFLWGKHDDNYHPPKKQIDLIRKKLDTMDGLSQRQQQCIKTKILDECHHYPQHEQPEALAKELLSLVEAYVDSSNTLKYNHSHVVDQRVIPITKVPSPLLESLQSFVPTRVKKISN